MPVTELVLLAMVLIFALIIPILAYRAGNRMVADAAAAGEKA